MCFYSKHEEVMQFMSSEGVGEHMFERLNIRNSQASHLSLTSVEVGLISLWLFSIINAQALLNNWSQKHGSLQELVKPLTRHMVVNLGLNSHSQPDLPLSLAHHWPWPAMSMLLHTNNPPTTGENIIRINSVWKDAYKTNVPVKLMKGGVLVFFAPRQ